MPTSRTTRVSKLQTKDKQLQDQVRKRNTKQKSFSRRQKVETDAEDTMSSGSQSDLRGSNRKRPVSDCV